MAEAAGIQTAVADSLAPQKPNELLLLREMNHRLANTLTVLISVLRCDVELPALPGLQDALARLEKRILAFSGLHRSLIVGVEKRRISVQVYVENLCKALSDAILAPLDLKCEVRVDAGELSSERCELLGLVIAELVTNAAKHAFRNRDDGVVRIELIREVDAWLCIVADNGDGITAIMSGAGSKIIEQLVQTMDGSLIKKSNPNGTSIVVTCPVAEAAVAQLRPTPN